MPLATIIGSLADCMTPAEIQAAYSQLTLEDIRGAPAYAAELLQQETLLPLTG
ncbi:MAG: DUF433 domain-containing protein [Chloroflexi bacterium]|nr:DUF433 domain-containing protein [Chloroflexota bacterium]